VRLGGLLALAVASVAVAGCGGRGKLSATVPAGTTIGQVGVVKVFVVRETEFKLTPDSFKVEGTGTYGFKAVNEGKVVHRLAVEGPGIYTQTNAIAPGKSVTFPVLLKEAGEYEVFDPKDGYRAKGMKATVQVP
jgi:uncharacterized cupredoxin-like copper-binding protein